MDPYANDAQRPGPDLTNPQCLIAELEMVKQGTDQQVAMAATGGGHHNPVALWARTGAALWYAIEQLKKDHPPVVEVKAPEAKPPAGVPRKDKAPVG
jgi:hypothetical protein